MRFCSRSRPSRTASFKNPPLRLSVACLTPSRHLLQPSRQKRALRVCTMYNTQASGLPSTAAHKTPSQNKLPSHPNAFTTLRQEKKGSDTPTGNSHSLLLTIQTAILGRRHRRPPASAPRRRTVVESLTFAGVIRVCGGFSNVAFSVSSV